MKTYNGWQKSGLDLTEYIKPMDRVDETIYMHMLEVVTPHFQKDGYFQVGEASHETDHVEYRDTFYTDNNRYWYLGELPSFVAYNW